MKKIIFLLFLATSFGFGQNNNPIGQFQRGGAFFTEDTSERIIAYKIKGSPYEMAEYANGYTSIFNKKGFDAPMRYNAAKDVIEFLDDDEKVKEVLRRPYITATFDGKTYEVLSYLEGENEKLGYFNALNIGKTQLLFMPRKMIKTSGPRFQEVALAYYQDASVYYLKKKDGPAIEINLNKTDLLSELGNKKTALSKFITDYDLNLKKETDAIRLIEYYNTLISPQPIQKKGQS